MKRLRWLGSLLALALALVLMGCDVTPTPHPGNSVAPTATPTTPPTSTKTSTVTPTFTLAPSPTASLTFTPKPPTRTSAPVASGQLRVHFIDVGQGDAILILGPDGKVALVDGGEASTGIVQYLKGQGVERIDLMVATHPHSDHIGGLVDVLRAMPVAEVVTNGQPHTTSIYEQFLDAIASAKAKYTEAKRGDRLQLGSIELEVLHPVSPTGDNLNDNSLVLRMAYGDTSLLLTGDVEATGQANVLSTGQPIQATILKVPHHGSSSSSPSFLASVKSQVAIYSCGVNNPYGHPDPGTIAALVKAGAKVYGTDINRTVVVTASGSGYSLTMAKSSAPRSPPTAAPPLAPTSAPTGQPSAGLTLEIVSLTSPIPHGANATLVARTTPGANCTITVYYKSGPSQAAGLVPKQAGTDGTVSWTWKVGANTTPGTWRIVITASIGGQTVSKETTFVVE